ncbi:hypothetical protein [Polaromonas sp. SM01]|uniref:hypothetical protein n=1 Tax=Polaromonas sp. SM01 TaxID=3085630 RepID=UPI0029814BCA|nr:hypothetical protein [Polaromonas sp. SM01]MDW5441480.1 hypothetical protein [Polaromonas sp. SM01]
MDEALSSEMVTAATKSRRRKLIAILALLLALTTAVVSVNLYDGQLVQLAQKQGEQQAVTDVSGAPKLGGSTPSAGAKLATGADELKKAPSRAPPGADAALTVRPLPATDAEVKTRQDLSIVEKCPPAVATLGLCNPDTPQEKH